MSSRPTVRAGKVGRPVLQLNKTQILALFDLPQPLAAHRLGVSVSGLKRECRKLGISQWPYKRTSHACATSNGAECSNSLMCSQDNAFGYAAHDTLCDLIHGHETQRTIDLAHTDQASHSIPGSFSEAAESHRWLESSRSRLQITTREKGGVQTWADHVELFLSIPTDTNLADDMDFVAILEAQGGNRGYLEQHAAEATACLAYV